MGYRIGMHALAALAGMGAALLAVAPAASQTTALSAGGETRPPSGYLQFCRDHPDACRERRLEPARVALNAKSRVEMEAVNRRINERVRPVTDIEMHGVEEHWSYAEDGAGDCEDYVLLKRRVLIERGWPEQALLITVVIDERGDGHAVLTVRTDEGDLILDNQREDIVEWSRSSYRFVKRQSERSPTRWVSVSPMPSHGHATAGNGRR